MSPPSGLWKRKTHTPKYEADRHLPSAESVPLLKPPRTQFIPRDVFYVFVCHTTLQESGVVVDERQVAQVMTMLANNYNSVNGPKGQGDKDDGELSSALTSSLFSAGEGKVCRVVPWCLVPVLVLVRGLCCFQLGVRLKRCFIGVSLMFSLCCVVFVFVFC